MIVFCLWILQSAIRNPQFAYFVVCANTDCFHLLHSITLPLPLSITLPLSLSITLPLPLSITLPLPLSIALPFSTLDYTSIFYARLCHHLPLSFLTISSNPTANDLLAMRLSPSHLHYHPTLQQTMHISPYILSNNVLCPPKMAHT